MLFDRGLVKVVEEGIDSPWLHLSWDPKDEEENVEEVG
jgi:hypothetical protein